MKSSAMRDLMAITERPEVISLAGGLPDTSTFPAESLAALLSKVAATDSARAAIYRRQLESWRADRLGAPAPANIGKTPGNAGG
jgi:DNA-binding transcriptional MocR family regulator